MQGRTLGASFSHGPTEEDMAWATSEQSLGTQKSMAVSMLEARSKDRNLARPCQMSSVEFGPRAPVTDLAWLPSFRAPRPDGRPHAVQPGHDGIVTLWTPVLPQHGYTSPCANSRWPASCLS